MTETPVDQPETQPAEQSVEEQQGAPELQHCRWCGQPQEAATAEGEDWLCESCERWQNTMTCPTCNQLTILSALPENMLPEPHAPTRRRKAKE